MEMARTRELLNQYLSVVSKARYSLEPVDPLENLRTTLHGRPWVLFAGAGLSCDPPAAAPTFIHLRNAATYAVSQQLVALSILSAADAEAITEGLIQLERRDDISLPPEVLFGAIGRALGNDFVYSLLRNSLAAGTPNANHHAIAKLARGTLNAVITPNFDEYVEQALAHEPPNRIVGTRRAGGAGLWLYKPHGSLDSPHEIQVSVFDMARPLTGPAREILKSYVKNRPVVVFGYSGQDRDLFPALLYAGREWGTEIVWLLYDHDSRNEAVAALQISLGESCTVIDMARRPVLVELANIDPLPSINSPDMSLSHLALLVKEQVSVKPPEDLIAAIIPNILPAGVHGGEAITGRLADALLSRAESMSKGDARTVLSYVGLAAAYLPNGKRRERAMELGLELAVRWGASSAIRAWQPAEPGAPSRDSPEGRFLDVVRQLDDLPDSPTDDARRSARVGLLIERALCLWDLGREEEAESETRRLLAESPWPASPMDSSVAFTGDACAPWELHCALAWFEADRVRVDAADEQLVAAMQLLWREPDLWTLGDALCSRVSTLAEMVGDRELQRLALDLALEVAQLSNDKNSERVTMEWRRRVR